MAAQSHRVALSIGEEEPRERAPREKACPAADGTRRRGLGRRRWKGRAAVAREKGLSCEMCGPLFISTGRRLVGSFHRQGPIILFQINGDLSRRRTMKPAVTTAAAGARGTVSQTVQHLTQMDQSGAGSPALGGSNRQPRCQRPNGQPAPLYPPAEHRRGGRRVPAAGDFNYGKWMEGLPPSHQPLLAVVRSLYRLASHKSQVDA
ncbi:hypothetical protein MTO96_001431 [Rhipicephalus appendiculatus]